MATRGKLTEADQLLGELAVAVIETTEEEAKALALRVFGDEGLGTVTPNARVWSTRLGKVQRTLREEPGVYELVLQTIQRVLQESEEEMEGVRKWAGIVNESITEELAAMNGGGIEEESRATMMTIVVQRSTEEEEVKEDDSGGE